jgi:polar amino acid transport system substrate-binding protein
LKCVLLLSLLGFVLSFFVEASPQQTLTMCIDHYPPLQVIENKNATGENVEVVKRLVKKLGMKLTFTANTPFKRCLEYLKQGQVDLMSGLLSSDQRRQYAHLFLYDDLTVKSLFIHKDSHPITEFAQLKGLNIGILRGVKQFTQFDTAPAGMFNKVEVNTLPAAFGMLAKKRLDVVITTDNYGMKILNKSQSINANVVKTQYQETNGTQVYIALSKKSKHVDKVRQFQNTARQMLLDGEFVDIIVEFQTNHPQYYP